jgi:hypothetical protein
MSNEKEPKDENIYERIRREAREKQEQLRERQRLADEQLARLTSWDGGVVRL